MELIEPTLIKRRWQRLCGTFCYINFAKVEYASGEYAESVWARSHLLVQFSLKKDFVLSISLYLQVS